MAYLAVRVWIGTAHHFPLVLKHLHPLIGAAQLCDLIGPVIHHLPNLRSLHQRKSNVGMRVEAHYSTTGREGREEKREREVEGERDYQNGQHIRCYQFESY